MRTELVHSVHNTPKSAAGGGKNQKYCKQLPLVSCVTRPFSRPEPAFPYRTYGRDTPVRVPAIVESGRPPACRSRPATSRADISPEPAWPRDSDTNCSACAPETNGRTSATDTGTSCNTSQVTRAYPFSAARHVHHVRASGYTVCLMSVPDTQSSALMFDSETWIGSRCHTSGEAVHIHIRNTDLLSPQPGTRQASRPGPT